MATKKKSVEIMGSTSDSVNEGKINKWVVLKENDILFVFHWCGATEKNEWFRKSVGWEGTSPHCELCIEPVPEKYSALVKLYMSGINP